MLQWICCTDAQTCDCCQHTFQHTFIHAYLFTYASFVLPCHSCRGVSWNKRTLKWQVTLYARGRYRYFGSYTNQEEAARAYDKAALVWKGPQAALNFPAEGYRSAQVCVTCIC